jgi:hypothetical protein
MFNPEYFRGIDSLPTIDPVLHKGDSMGKHNRFGPPTTTVLSPNICQRDRLSGKINMVVVDRPSPKPKKRPALAGLFLF